MIMSSYFNVFAPKNDKDLCWYRPKPHFARGVSKLLEGSVKLCVGHYICLYQATQLGSSAARFNPVVAYILYSIHYF